MHTDTFNSAAHNEVCNGGIIYDYNHQARAAVYGNQIIMSKGKVQHSFHASTQIEKLARCWQNLIKN